MNKISNRVYMCIQDRTREKCFNKFGSTWNKTFNKFAEKLQVLHFNKIRINNCLRENVENHL